MMNFSSKLHKIPKFHILSMHDRVFPRLPPNFFLWWKNKMAWSHLYLTSTVSAQMLHVFTETHTEVTDILHRVCLTSNSHPD